MDPSRLKLIWAFVLALPLALASMGASAAVITQLGFAIDGSGSINPTEFNTQRTGLANAFGALPTDGSVELTLVQFASSAQLEIAPTVITAGNLASVQAQVNSIIQTGGGTVPGNAVDLLTAQMTGSANFNGGSVDSIINLSTDGGFFLPSAITSAENSKAAGIDALTAEAIGPGASTSNLLSMVYNPSSNPNDGSATLLATDANPPNPLTNPAWVVPVSNFAAFEGVVTAKIQAVAPTPVPEPGILALLAIGLIALGVVRVRRNQDGMGMAAAA